jgi:negative regulator of sigma E activity
MNDEPTTDALSRASAYLDGELDAAEIAAAEADPAVMAEVAELRLLQDAIRDVATPTSHARDTAIAAALVEFDRRRHPAPVVRSRPRPAYSRWLAVAAAVTGLAALGVVASTLRGGDEDDAAEQLTAVTEFAAAGDADDAARSSTGGAPEAPQPSSAQSETMLATGATGAPSATESAAGADAVAESEAAATVAPATTAAASDASPAPFDPNTPIPDELELGRIGRELLAELTAGTRTTMTGTACDSTVTDLVVLSDAVLIVDGAARPVLVAADRATDETFALDPDTCVVVATGR